MAEIMARGPNFVYAKEFIFQEYGQETWQKLLDTLPESVIEIWKLPHLITEEYPFSAFKILVANLSMLVGAENQHQTVSLYEYIADRSLHTVYKVFFRFANPAFVIRNYPKLWQRFFTVGIVEVPTAQKGYAVLDFTLPEVFLDWLPSACFGFSKKAVEMAGGQDLKIQESAKKKESGGLWKISYELRWRE